MGNTIVRVQFDTSRCEARKWEGVGSNIGTAMGNTIVGVQFNTGQCEARKWEGVGSNMRYWPMLSQPFFTSMSKKASSTSMHPTVLAELQSISTTEKKAIQDHQAAKPLYIGMAMGNIIIGVQFDTGWCKAHKWEGVGSNIGMAMGDTIIGVQYDTGWCKECKWAWCGLK
ncbi:hypothetical protein BS47DRAFT_1361457 [Hydnum rufescens UP504]|uniref:Uncharacterized protein n=1 Tax=Hydnum rufescens UP504 TaxID=1448309 RepID=A0A9P6AZ74_9AGAM|nr:hypothetical protein BS47DRAFT_1361457 [Hydnum rufescens UP504]